MILMSELVLLLELALLALSIIKTIDNFKISIIKCQDLSREIARKIEEYQDEQIHNECEQDKSIEPNISGEWDQAALYWW